HPIRLEDRIRVRWRIVSRSGLCLEFRWFVQWNGCSTGTDAAFSIKPRGLPRRSLHGQRRFEAAGARLAWAARHWEIISNDRFGNQTIGTRRQAVTEAEFDIERAKFEIGHAEYLMPLLLERQKVSNLAEVGIIFDADKTVLTEIAREPGRRQEIDLAERAQSNVDDRIDDELPFLVAHAD